ncbi:hypothetical protein CYMTET_41563 [Cymbomonas tetramitiformis]|uniref:Uncharacterized protein n=1 Tax=Cymbomonas tetramitiformis TaxID=36881 RepID=A0AAE0F2E3_9CHLO|nr:hypothetical protein CYMTET_41563 [Cymbomonas tetramitiformis]
MVRAGEKVHLRAILVAIGVRMVLWETHATRGYWIFPYSDQEVIKLVLSLSVELLRVPYDINLKSTIGFTPYDEDCQFALGMNAHSFWWRVMALGNPLYMRMEKDRTSY